MSDGNFFTELAETRRRLWAESDGSLEGYAALCSRIAREAVAADAKEQAGRKVPDKRTPPRRRRKAHGPMMVREDAPGYGTGKKDFARKGAEGDAV